jgi:hypothetical protein
MRTIACVPGTGQTEILGPHGEYRAPMSLCRVAVAEPVDDGYI